MTPLMNDVRERRPYALREDRLRYELRLVDLQPVSCRNDVQRRTLQMRLELLSDIHRDVRVIFTPDYFGRDVERFHHRNSRGVAVQLSEELRRHLRKRPRRA